MNRFQNAACFAGRLLGAALLCSALFGGTGFRMRARAQPAKNDDAASYTIHKLTYKKGDIDRYKMLINMRIAGSGGENEFDMDFKFKQATRDAGEDGSYTLLQEFEEAKVTTQGTEQDMTSSLPKITLRRDRDGKVTAKTEGGSEQAAQITTMLGNFSKSQEAFYPTKPVKIGDKWKVSFDGPTAAGTNTKVTGEATLLRTETVGGTKTLAIKVVTSSDASGAQQVQGTNEQLLNIDPETGKLIRMTVNSDIDGGAGSFKMKMKMEMNLLPKEAKAEKQ